MKGTKPTKHWMLSLLALFLAGAPLAARAAQPTSAAEADQRAQHYQGLVKATSSRAARSTRPGSFNAPRWTPTIAQL